MEPLSVTKGQKEQRAVRITAMLEEPIPQTTILVAYASDFNIRCHKGLGLTLPSGHTSRQ